MEAVGQSAAVKDNYVMADCRRYLTIFEWRLFFSRLRIRGASMVEGERESVRVAIATDADQR